MNKINSSRPRANTITVILEPLQLEERNDGFQNKWPRLIFFFLLKGKNEMCREPPIQLFRKAVTFSGGKLLWLLMTQGLKYSGKKGKARG